MGAEAVGFRQDDEFTDVYGVFTTKAAQAVANLDRQKHPVCFHSMSCDYSRLQFPVYWKPTARIYYPQPTPWQSGLPWTCGWLRQVDVRFN
jgi:hypothetical protein